MNEVTEPAAGPSETRAPPLPPPQPPTVHPDPSAQQGVGAMGQSAADAAATAALFQDADAQSAISMLAAQISGPQLDVQLSQLAQMVASGNSGDIVHNLQRILASGGLGNAAPRNMTAEPDDVATTVGDLAPVDFAQQANFAAALNKYTDTPYASSAAQAAAAAAVARSQLIMGSDNPFSMSAARPGLNMASASAAAANSRKRKPRPAIGSSAKARRKSTVDDKRERMRCWNCTSDCPNRGSGPERHYVAGMCGRCHQRWIKHPDNRWPVAVCVSKCRCGRCDHHRAVYSKPTCDYVPVSPALAGENLQKLKQFDSVVVAGAEKVGVKTLLHENIDLLLTEPNPTMASVLALFSFVGSELSSFESIDATAAVPGTPEPDWPGLLIVPGGTHGLGAVRECNDAAMDIYGASLSGLQLHRTALPKVSLLPFIAAYLKVSLGRPPQQLAVTFRTVSGVEIPVALKLQFTVDHELAVYMCRLANDPPPQPTATPTPPPPPPPPLPPLPLPLQGPMYEQAEEMALPEDKDAQADCLEAPVLDGRV